MLSALTGALMGSPTKSPSRQETSNNTYNVNMNPRGNKTQQTSNNRQVSRSLDFQEDSITTRMSNSAKLLSEIKLKDSEINSLQSKVIRLQDELTILKHHGSSNISNNNIDDVKNNSNITKRSHYVSGKSHIIFEDHCEEESIGTRGSILTKNVLEEIPDVIKSETELLAQKFIQVFKNPVDYIPYLKSDTFANDLIKVCQEGC